MTPTLILAAAAESDPSSLTVGMVAVGLLLLLNLALTAKQLFGENKGERQIEPTQLAAIQTEQKAQTALLTTLNREVGTLSTLAGQVEGLHVRVGGISRELAHTVARVDGLEKREGQRRA